MYYSLAPQALAAHGILPLLRESLESIRHTRRPIRRSRVSLGKLLGSSNERLSYSNYITLYIEDFSVHFPLYTLDANRLDRRFRWAALQLEELQDCSDEAEIRETLRNIPPTLEQTYERTLTRIPEKNQARVRKILLWLIYSFRPMSLQEVAAVADLPFPEDVLRMCTSSLVSTSTGSISIDGWNETKCEIVRLAHFSVQEYLCSGKTRIIDSDPSFYLPAKPGHFEIGMQCVKELFKLDEVLEYSSSTVKSDDEPDDKPDDKPDDEPGNRPNSKPGDKPDDEPEDGPDDESDDEPDNRSISSLHHQHEPASHLEPSIASISQNTDNDSDNFSIRSIIQRRNCGFVQRVLDHSPLLAYSILHWVEHAKLIQPADTETRALVNLIDEFFSRETSLCYATYLRCYHAISPDHLDRYGKRKRIRPIIFASSHGLIDNIFKLIQQEVNVNVIDPEFGHGTALVAASAKGHVNIVQLLLESGADVNLKNGKSSRYGSALVAASAEGHANIVQLLLESGADVNLKIEELSRYGSAFVAASAEGHANIVQLLLESGADVNLKNEHSLDYGTALEAASAQGHANIVQLLLESGADVNLECESRHYLSALVTASAEGHASIVQLLLESGANVNFKNEHSLDYGTALVAASAEGHANIVQLLLESGADVNLRASRGYTPLQAACNNGRISVLPYLLKAGAGVNLVLEDAEHETALQAACASYSAERPNIIADLLKAGADVNQKGSLTALQLACKEGDAGLIAQLLNAGADPNLKGQRKNFPLVYFPLVLAIKKKHHKVVVQLLKAGADPNIQDRSDRTPLWYARHSDDSGKDRMIETLLAAGAANVDASHDEKDNISRSYTSPRSVGSGASSTASSDVEE